MKKSKKSIQAMLEAMKKGNERQATNKIISYALQKLNSEEYECDYEAVYTADKKTLVFLFGKQSAFAVPEGVETVEERAGYRNLVIAKITFPASMKEIRRDAFYDCDTLTELTIPAGVERIENYAFGDCDGLKVVRFLGTPKHLGRHAFESCDHLHEIIVPADSVKKFVKALHLNDENADLVIPDSESTPKKAENKDKAKDKIKNKKEKASKKDDKEKKSSEKDKGKEKANDSNKDNPKTDSSKTSES